MTEGVGSAFFGVLVVIWPFLRTFFLIFVGKHVLQLFYDLFSVVGVVFRCVLIGVYCRVLRCDCEDSDFIRRLKTYLSKFFSI